MSPAHEASLAPATPRLNWTRICYYGILPLIALAELEVMVHRTLAWTYDVAEVRQLIWLAPIAWAIYAMRMFFHLRSTKPPGPQLAQRTLVGYMAMMMTALLLLAGLSHR